MKKLSIVFICLLLLCLCGCSAQATAKKDTTLKQNQLLGSWQADTISNSINEISTISFEENYTFNQKIHLADNTTIYIDGTYGINSDSVVLDGQINSGEKDGNPLTQEEISQLIGFKQCTVLDYNTKNDTLVANNNGQSEIYSPIYN